MPLTLYVTYFGIRSFGPLSKIILSSLERRDFAGRPELKLPDYKPDTYRLRNGGVTKDARQKRDILSAGLTKSQTIDSLDDTWKTLTADKFEPDHGKTTSLVD